MRAHVVQVALIQKYSRQDLMILGTKSCLKAMTYGILVSRPLLNHEGGWLLFITVLNNIPVLYMEGQHVDSHYFAFSVDVVGIGRQKCVYRSIKNACWCGTGNNYITSHGPITVGEI